MEARLEQLGPNASDNASTSAYNQVTVTQDTTRDAQEAFTDSSVGNASRDGMQQSQVDGNTKDEPNGHFAGTGRQHMDEPTPGTMNGTRGNARASQVDGAGSSTMTNPSSDRAEVLCGPLLNFQRMDYEGTGATWHGSVLIVTKPGPNPPRLELTQTGPTRNDAVEGIASSSRRSVRRVEHLRLYEDPTKAFWRYLIVLPLADTETKWQYLIPGIHFNSEVSTSPIREFVVPAIHESMRLMFHSCNGFSVGTDEDFWSGPVLWNDVLRTHVARPFHVMIGGGDQIYNDGIRVGGPLKKWTDIKNPEKRRHFPFDEELRAKCDDYYFENYVRWYSTEPFASANATIPQINIWDDHDIIDGFGSYTDHFMKCAVFRGIGGTSFKYYCLFQHHTAPPVSTFTTDAPATMRAGPNGTAGADPRQTKDTFVYKRTADDPSWIVGERPGPYVEERSRSLYMRLGRRICFVGVDARTERTRHQVNYPDTYDLIFRRVEKELGAANGEIKHLILLLGVPIAYPRLAWLENIISSPIIAPLRLLNKRFGLAGGVFNQFDGGVDLMDDLDDHYTSKHHKKERRELVIRLQRLAAEFHVRVTILGGDVHLAAFGRFYSSPQSNMLAAHDPRFMANVISSAITNKPPPAAVANLIGRRNKIHHLRDGHTDETLLKMFDRQPGGKEKGAAWNKVTMPSRNYACITEVPGEEDDAQAIDGVNGMDTHGAVPDAGYHGKHRPSTKTDGHFPLHPGEENAGTQHPAADGVSTTGGIRGGLNVSIRVEIDNHSRQGECEGYGVSIPPLTLEKGVSSYF